MSTIARIVCLANAHKDGERCLAGKRMLPGGSLGEWIRPVSSRSKQTLSGRFEYGPLGHNYKFTITDPAFEEKYSNKASKFWIERCCLTISLTDVHTDGYAYKLIAGITEKP